jgi:hypothetical protein
MGTVNGEGTGYLSQDRWEQEAEEPLELDLGMFMLTEPGREDYPDVRTVFDQQVEGEEKEMERLVSKLLRWHRDDNTVIIPVNNVEEDECSEVYRILTADYAINGKSHVLCYIHTVPQHPVAITLKNLKLRVAGKKEPYTERAWKLWAQEQEHLSFWDYLQACKYFNRDTFA